MSSGEKILSVIRADSEETIAEIKKQSEEIRQAILSKADEKAKEIAQTAQIKKAELTDRLKKSNQSRIELEKRSMVLKTKREEIEKAVTSVNKFYNSHIVLCSINRFRESMWKQRKRPAPMQTHCA